MGKQRKPSSQFPPPAEPERSSVAPNDVVAVILAAGKGERMGGPKALLAWPQAVSVVPPNDASRGGRVPPPPEPSRPARVVPPPAPSRTGRMAPPPEPSRPGRPAVPMVPLAIAHAEARLAGECARALVVVRATMLTSLLGYTRPGIDLLSSNAADELGPAGSLAFAVSRLPAVAAVVVTPVDVPPARASTVARLLARLDQGGDRVLAVRPRVGARTGHPVVLRLAALEAYRSGSPPPLRDHLRALGDRVVDEEVDDPQVLDDLDTSADVVRLLGAPPRFLG
jgi:CTP:molybdopterin cytidylyltransferase MocA